VCTQTLLVLTPHIKRRVTSKPASKGMMGKNSIKVKHSTKIVMLYSTATPSSASFINSTRSEASTKEIEGEPIMFSNLSTHFHKYLSVTRKQHQTDLTWIIWARTENTWHTKVQAGEDLEGSMRRRTRLLFIRLKEDGDAVSFSVIETPKKIQLPNEQVCVASEKLAKTSGRYYH
jgi:hypothetical protein